MDVKCVYMFLSFQEPAAGPLPSSSFPPAAGEVGKGPAAFRLCVCVCVCV